MKSDKNILIAFLLNICFSLFELFGGFLTNSVAIISDAMHDFGDALSIGLSYFLEKRSHKGPDKKYTYGYIRYSILGALITSTILIVGTIGVSYAAVVRFFHATELHYDGMIIFAVIGVVINFLASYFTRDGSSLNMKSVNLHMLEDVFNWLVVLIGSILMKFTNINIIDSIMSLGIAFFLLIHAGKNVKTILDLFLEKIPDNISILLLEKELLEIDGVKQVHHIHLWSIDGIQNYATMHIVTSKKNNSSIKNQVRETLKKYNIYHVTIELENENEVCNDKECHMHFQEKQHEHYHV